MPTPVQVRTHVNSFDEVRRALEQLNSQVNSLFGTGGSLSTPISGANGGTGADLSSGTGFLRMATGTGALVGETGSGSVVRATSPTIVTPTIASFTNAQHAHQNAAGGGSLDVAAIGSGTFGVTRGGTGLNSATQGDMLYASAANTLTVLAKNTTATRYISNQGASNGPAWSQISLGDGVTGYLDLDNMVSGRRGMVGRMENVGFSISGNDIVINQANGSAFADSDGNRGYVWLRSTTDGQIARFTVTANVTLSPTGAHWGLGTKGDVTGALLRIYAINDGGTLKWGVGYCGGFTYLRNTQDSTTATDIDQPEEILVNSGISTDNSPCSDVGYVTATFDDTGGASEDLWTPTATYPGQSADGIPQTWLPVLTGFSVNPTYEAYWVQHGRWVTVYWELGAGTSGTSNSTSKGCTGPIKANNANSRYEFAYGLNNGGSVGVTMNPTTDASAAINIRREITLLSWTASGACGFITRLTYRMYQP